MAQVIKAKPKQAGQGGGGRFMWLASSLFQLPQQTLSRGISILATLMQHITLTASILLALLTLLCVWGGGYILYKQRNQPPKFTTQNSHRTRLP